MKIEITNERLYAYHQELLQISGQSILGILMKSKIAKFYKDNGIRIDTLIEKLKALNKEYVQFTDDGVMMMNGDKPKMRIGKEFDEFDIAVKKLQQTKVAITI